LYVKSPFFSEASLSELFLRCRNTKFSLDMDLIRR